MAGIWAVFSGDRLKFFQNPYVRIVFISLFWACAGIFIASLDILGAESATDRTSDAIIQRLSARNYGVRSFNKDGIGQDAITILYVNDRPERIRDLYKKHLASSWPIGTNDYTTLINTLVAYRPIAIYLDYTFVGPLFDGSTEKKCKPPGYGETPVKGVDYEGPVCSYWPFLEAVSKAVNYDGWSAGCKSAVFPTPLERIACIRNAQGIPVILGAPAEKYIREGAFQKELERYALLSPTLIQEDGLQIEQKLPVEPALGQATPEKKLVKESFTAALNLYAVWCSDTDIKKKPCVSHNKDSSSKSEFAISDFSRPLSVVWGSTPPYSRNQDLEPQSTNLECRARLYLRQDADGRDTLWAGAQNIAGTAGREGQNLFFNVFQGLKRFLEKQNNAGKADASPPQLCSYNHLLEYNALAGNDEMTLSPYLNKKIILVGNIFIAGPDWIDSPVLGSVPGVFYHAMATDNLIENQEKYRYSDGDGLPIGNLIAAILVALFSMVGLFGKLEVERIKDYAEISANTLRKKLSGICWLQFLLLNITLVAIISVTLTYPHIFNTPVNWIGALLTGYGLFVSIMRPVYFDHIHKHYNGYPGWRGLVHKLLVHASRVFKWLDIEEARPHLPEGPSTPGPLNSK